MKIAPVRTERVEPGVATLHELLGTALQDLTEKSVVAITSKIVAICEGRVVPADEATKDELIREEADLYLPAEISDYGYHFTITNHTLAAAAGIDESNGAGYYVLWPSDAQDTANEIRRYLRQRFGLQKVGVVITDSASTPFRLGATGIALGYSGFKGLNDYVGTPDLFGKPFSVSRANIAGGLASAATLVMGEGTEQTPICIMEELPFVEFMDDDPDEKELEGMCLTLSDDLFAPFFENAPWKKGRTNRS